MKAALRTIAGLLFVLVIFAFNINSHLEYIHGYLFRGGTMYENQVIMIDKIFPALDNIEYSLDNILSAVQALY